MITLLIGLTLLTQAPGYWVEFEICQIDRRSLPHVAKRLDPSEIMSIWVTNERKPGLLDIYPKPEGLECTHMIYKEQGIYVIGSRNAIKSKLDGPR